MRPIIVSLCVGALAPGALAQFVEPDAGPLYTVQRGSGFGWAVSELEDIDGDGVMEGIASAPSVQGSRGRVTVFSGATGVILFEATGDAVGVSLGWGIADVGDVNNDGFHDVGAGSLTRGGRGSVLVYSGNPASYGDVLLDIVSTQGPAFGYALSRLEDINDDGHDDFVVGEPGAQQAHVVSGADGSFIHTVNGSGLTATGHGQGVAGIGDVDDDGVSDFAVSAAFEKLAYVYSGATGALIHTLTPDASASNNFGQFFVGRCGDVSGDGVPDVYIGDYTDSKAYVFSGADGSRWLTIDGGPGNGLGPGRGLMADINQDGHQDLAVGWYTNSDGAAGGGKITITSGADGSTLRTITGTNGGHQLGFDCVGIGDVNNDGFPDILASASSGNRVHLVPGVNPCPADIDLDADADMNDIALYVGAFVDADPSNADLDSDGDEDPDDIAAFVASFVTGCP